MNGHGATVAACDLQVNEDKTNMDLVVKEVVDLAKIGEVLEDVDSESQKLVLDMRSLPEEDMQVVHQSLYGSNLSAQVCKDGNTVAFR